MPKVTVYVMHDVTNGLIAGSAFQILTENQQISIWLRVEIVILIIVGSILLQHFFKPARIVLGVIPPRS